ncbi:MAG TPA: glycerol-3-phosphate acyltransferase [Candidatus Humimicrobiaceae bacterium]|nr:glycerol-3-phosphate acyltransferase [Candidatus Humimicrobiaceae bacterium]
MSLSIAIIIISYLLGSIPFGFIFSKISGKEIFKIGWRKSSGSNVFRYVGVWQGIATGFCDIGKGFLAVFLAQNFGLSLPFQALCGAAAVMGNNWSCFMKFAGGRGVGAFLGAFLALSPKLAGFSVIPFILISLVWNSSIGTFFFLAVSFFLSVYFGQFQTVSILILASLAPIFVKRLSPVREIFLAKEKSTLISNRLIFDNDKPCSGLRITRIINKLTWW